MLCRYRYALGSRHHLDQNLANWCRDSDCANLKETTRCDRVMLSDAINGKQLALKMSVCIVARNFNHKPKRKGDRRFMGWAQPGSRFVSCVRARRVYVKWDRVNIYERTISADDFPFPFPGGRFSIFISPQYKFISSWLYYEIIYNLNKSFRL